VGIIITPHVLKQPPPDKTPAPTTLKKDNEKKEEPKSIPAW